MGYRRTREATELARRWRDFTAQQDTLFEAAGLPGSLQEEHRLFDYFLMHGYVEDGSSFSTEQLTEDQRAALDQLVAAYIARFYDPGVSLGPTSD